MNSPLKKRYTPAITTNDSFPICMYEFRLVDDILIHEEVLPSTISVAGELRSERLCFASLV